MSSLQVRILQLGRRVISHQAQDGATLARVLAEVGLPAAPAGVDVRVNGQTAVADRVLADGDVVTLIPRIKGGCGADGGAHHTHAVAHNGPPQMHVDLAAAARAIAAQEEIRCHHVGFIGYGTTAPGQRVLLAVDSHYDPAVVDAFRDALRERGARVDTLVLDAGEDRPFEYLDEIRVVMRRGPWRNAPRRWEGVPWVEEFAEQRGYDLLIHGKGGPIPATNFRYEQIPWLKAEQLASPATTYPLELHQLINRKT